MKLIVNNLAVEYQESGSGPVVLLLHGWAQDHKTFNDLSDKLSRDYKVIRLDLPGFGATDQPKQAWDITEYASFVKAFLEKLKADQISAIVGHSFGGRVAIKMTAADSHIAKHLILIDAAGVRHDRSARNRLFLVVAKAGKAATLLPGLRQARNKLRHSLYKAAGSDDYLKAGRMRDIFSKTISEDLQADAAKIKSETILIWGENDHETPLTDGKKLEAAIPNAKLIVLEGAGHFAYLDKPHEVAEIIEKAIK